MKPTALAAASQPLGLEILSDATLSGRSPHAAPSKPVVIVGALAALLAASALLKFGRRSKSSRKSGSVIGTILKSVALTAVVTIAKQKLLPHPHGAKIGLPSSASEVAA
jgi:hypothetical protein